MKMVIPVVAVAMAALPAQRAAAQACLGLPTRDGAIAVAAVADLGQGDAAYGAEFTADVSGPASFRFGYTDAGDGDARTFTGLASYDFFLVEPSVCAVGGVTYVADPEPHVADRLGVPVGLGIGKTLAYPHYSATIYALPQYVWVREKVTDPLRGETTGTSNEFRAEAGATLALFPFYVGGAVVVSTVGDGDPAFRLRLGLTF